VCVCVRAWKQRESEHWSLQHLNCLLISRDCIIYKVTGSIRKRRKGQKRNMSEIVIQGRNIIWKRQGASWNASPESDLRICQCSCTILIKAHLIQLEGYGNIGSKILGSQMEREMGKQNKCKQIRRQVKKGKWLEVVTVIYGCHIFTTLMRYTPQEK